MKKTLLIWLLCMVTALGAVWAGAPIAAFAEGEEETEVPAPDMAGIEPAATSVTAYMTGYLYQTADTEDGVARVPLQGVPEGFVFDEANEDTSFKVNKTSSSAVIAKSGISLEDNTLVFRARGAGIAKVSFTINQKKFTVTFTCYKPEMQATHLMRLKQKKTLKVTGLPAGAKVRFSSSDKKIATVTAKGVVRAKKKGNAVIYAQAGTVKIGAVVSVTTKKKVRAIKRAQKIARTSQYSQPRRMQKGYYDCSSLVWRAYSKEGYRFGVRFWAPVAADEAKYLAKRHKIYCKLNRANLQKMRYQAGDLLFITGAKNGRYKGIYHVEMFRGYRFDGFTPTGQPVVASCWANFSDGYADYRTDGIFGRP